MVLVRLYLWVGAEECCWWVERGHGGLMFDKGGSYLLGGEEGVEVALHLGLNCYIPITFEFRS